ncbi:acyl-CoA synthetase [Bradyrhizobium manausense]|uniref:acyl-CoA synthetase n=1 Tax=Bradyrhizobium TaxID=374 RepID=UPI001BACF88E|nr:MULTISPECIES: acyl-CoA synthetase [Bradyrhizobium]MBR0826786.1 acyl-CoA synthetase [Bradyrhizobium manausense]UVO32072.1 acyl-CoA synthetase [Bradyrhizobium arachidis]
MAGIHALDRLIGDSYPELTTDEEVREFERVPYADRVAAASTYEAMKLGATRNPDAPAIQFLQNADPADTPVVVTYRDLVARITQAANMFHALGAGKDDVISFMLPLVPDAFVTLLGAEAAGIANPVNPLLEPHQIAEILEAANTKILVALGPMPGTDIWQKVEQIRPQLKHLKAIVQVFGGGDPANGIYSFNDLIKQQPADRLVSDRKILDSDIAAYFHTGGTTGTPKLVRHTHANQVYQAWALNLLLQTKPGGNLLFGMPLFHVGGSLTQVLTTLSGGGSLVVLSPSGWRNPNAVKNIWALVERFKPEALSSVPTVLAATLGIPRGNADISSLKYAAGGGSAIPVAVGSAIQDKLKLPVVEVYGMTETSSVHTIAYPSRPIRLGSVGLPMPYARVRVVKLDADGRLLGDCAPDEIGVVIMAGPGVFGGYLNDTHNKGAFVDDIWVNSGDLGRLDKDGYLWITGRAKDLVIRGGHNIDPAPIEEIMFQHPAVGFAAVVGQPDAYAGELPVGYVQLKPGATVQPGELEAWVRERTPERAAVPVQVIPIDPMPVTGVGKVFKPQLRWDAAQRVFTNVLAPLTEKGIDCKVKVGAHGSHGSIATVTIAGVAADKREAVTGEVQKLLGPFVMRHEVVFG